MARFTFARQPRATGLARVAERSTTTLIKLKSKECGYISIPLGSGAPCIIRFAVKQADHPGWGWMQLKARPASEQEARQWLADNTDAILAKHTLHFFEG